MPRVSQVTARLLAILALATPSAVTVAITPGVLTHAIAANPTAPQARQVKERLLTTADHLSGTLAVESISALAQKWDPATLAPPLKLSDCAHCQDAAAREALADAAAALGALKGIEKVQGGKFHVSGDDGGQMTIYDNGNIEIAPANNVLFERTVCYLASFERGTAKFTVALRGTDDTRQIVMMHIRPVAPLAFRPVTLGNFEPWIWQNAKTW